MQTGAADWLCKQVVLSYEQVLDMSIVTVIKPACPCGLLHKSVGQSG